MKTAAQIAEMWMWAYAKRLAQPMMAMLDKIEDIKDEVASVETVACELFGQMAEIFSGSWKIISDQDTE